MTALRTDHKDDELIDGFIRDAHPFVRSITGDGVRQTLLAVQARVPIDIVEVPTGMPALDWVVPEEWNVRRAFIEDPTGKRIVDLAENALHLVSYSEPVDAYFTLDELRPHLHSMPDRPDWVPYRTSYWRRTWGFCLTHRQLSALEQGSYRVVIDSDFSEGSMTYGELVIPGTTDAEVLLTTHTCHPSMINDNLSGIGALCVVARRLLDGPRLRHTVRMLFLPGTIGAISWLATHRDGVAKIRGGLAVTGLGDASPLTYKSSRRSSTAFDRVATRVVRRHDVSARILPWDPYGYDERQFCSPAFDLAFGRLTRGVHGRYGEYHTSADNRSFTSTERIVEAVDALEDIVRSFDRRTPVRNLAPEGEPQLGRRGLYSETGGAIDGKSVEMAYLWVLSLADGDHDADDICEASGLESTVVFEALRRLHDCGLAQIHIGESPGPR